MKATQTRRNAVPRKVLATLGRLARRVPGAAPRARARAKKTFVAGQLIRVDEDTVTIRLGPNDYAFAISEIEDIRDLDVPRGARTESGVDVVVLLKRGAIATTAAMNIAAAPEGERPFPLARPRIDLSMNEAEWRELRKRGERWGRLNALLVDTVRANQGDLDAEGSCTCFETCTALTYTGNAPVCDTTDPTQDLMHW